jgi:sulfonate transport system substrate-binding protein
MDEASANAALTTRNIDAAFGNYGVLLLTDKGLAKIVYTTKGQDPAFERQSTLIAADSFVASHPDLTQRVITAIVKAAYWSIFGLAPAVRHRCIGQISIVRR